MYIYRGKFNWENYATNEPFTIIFPGDFELGDDAFASWTFSANKDQLILTGSIDSITPVNNKIVLFASSTYWIDITFPDSDPDNKTLTANVYHKFKTIDTYPKMATLELVYHITDEFELRSNSLVAAPISRIYYGTLNTANSDAKNELFILVIPHTVLAEEPLCAYWMWTTEKTNVNIKGSISSVTGSTIAYTDGSGQYAIAGDDPGAVGTMKVSLMYSNTTTSISLTLASTPAIYDADYIQTQTEAAKSSTAKSSAKSQLKPEALSVQAFPPISISQSALAMSTTAASSAQAQATQTTPSTTVLNTPSPQKISIISNDLKEPVWCSMYEAKASEPGIISTISAWLGLGLSLVGMHPTIKQPYAITVGALSLVLSTVGIYDATSRVGPAQSELDTLYLSETMWRASLHRGPEVNQTANAATFIRVHVVGQNTLKHLSRGVVHTSEIFADTKIAKDLFSIVMPDNFQILPFRIYEIVGLVPEQGTTTSDNTWFEGPAAVNFTRGEMATVDISTINRKTLKRHGNLSVNYGTSTIFKYDKNIVLLCVEDNQTIAKDGYDFFWVSNTAKLTFLRLPACKVQSVTDSIEIGFFYGEDTLRRLMAVKYKGFDVYWIEQRKDPDDKTVKDFLCAGKCNKDMIISAASSSPKWTVMIRVTNWHSELRMVKL